MSDGKKTYEVWHDARPESRPSTPSFPEGFVHAANVQANGLLETVDKVNRTGTALEPWLPWEKFEGVQPLVETPRDTVLGDVIVDPGGRPFRMERQGFKEVGKDDVDMDR